MNISLTINEIVNNKYFFYIENERKDFTRIFKKNILEN